jgi:hypothetical protein
MNANDLFKAVMQLDLEPIKMKLMHVESGEGWSLEKANAVEKEYRRFLCLMKMYPEEDTAPLVDVDTFWHYHILDTMKYAADCEQAFGYFLHHYPYVGMRGEDDEQFRLDSGNRMRDLYEATFGEAYPGTEAEEMPAARAAGNETAWCAGPWTNPPSKQVKGVVAAGTAWCAGPWTNPPSKQVKGVVAAGTAWCAGPWTNPPSKQVKGVVAAGTAWCAGPWTNPPSKQVKGVVAAGTAWCAGPWTNPPSKQVKGVVAANTAWCAGPWKQKSTRVANKAAAAA